MKCLWIFIMSFWSCSAVIYHLNDTEYQIMPPLFLLDEYDSCMVEEGSTYCMLQLTLYAESGNELMRIITEYSDHGSKHYNHSLIDRGVCVKKSCQKYFDSSNKTEDLTRNLEVCLNDSTQREYGLNAKLSTLYYCNYNNEHYDIDDWDWTVLVIIIGFVIINSVGSLYDYCVSKKIKEQPGNVNAFLLSFSLINNWKRLTNMETADPDTQDLQFLHGSRVVANMFIILAHAMMGVTAGFMINPHAIEKSFEHPLYQVLYNGLNVVQVFFFISGFLTVYKLEAMNQRFTIWDVPKIMLLRFSRLVPALAMTLALTTTWVRHIGSGPLWKLYVADSLVAECRANGWHHLFFLNNYLQKVNFCLIPTWHLAADFQVFLICVTLYILAKNRHLMLGLLLLLGISAPAIHTTLQDLDTTIFTPPFFRKLESRNFWLQHVLGHNNMPCFIVGMGTAVLIHKWQKNGGHLVKRQWFEVFNYVGLVSIPLVLYTGHVFFNDGPRAPVLARAAYSAVIRLLLGLTCTFLAFGFFTKTSTSLKSFFEWRYWVVPSRLSYCVFLVHMIFVHIMTGVKTQLSYFSFYDMMTVHVIVVVASYLVSVPLCLMVEAPFTMLFKEIVMKPKQRKSLLNGKTICNNGNKKHK